MFYKRTEKIVLGVYAMNGDLLLYLYALPAILLSLSFHEMSHAYVSYRLGDPTAKSVGRLSLNPLKHLDPLGTLMLVVSLYYGRGFGWARPVPINPMYYKDKKRGTMLVSLAGPLSNLLLALIFAFPMLFTGIKCGLSPDEIFNMNILLNTNIIVLMPIIFNVCKFFYIINISLAVFNIIPVPPLDGSKILSGLLPSRYYFKLMRYENYVGLAFLLLIFALPQVLSTILSPFTWAAESLIRLTVMLFAGIFS